MVLGAHIFLMHKHCHCVLASTVWRETLMNEFENLQNNET